MAALTDATLTEQVKPYTKSGPERIAGMIAAVRSIDREAIPGAIVECGVWKGGNIILARKLSPRRVCWLYDTFAGMTRPEAVDVNRSGMKATELYPLKTNWQSVSIEDVRQALIETDTLDERKLRFVVGDVTETLLGPVKLPREIALLRLDTDWHASTKVELEVLYPLLAPGGVLIVDDYGHWQGARKAVDDYFGGGGPRIEMIDYTAAMMVKPWRS